MNVYTVYPAYNRPGFFGVSQETINGYPWDHAVQTGYHPSREAATAWAVQHAGRREYKVIQK